MAEWNLITDEAAKEVWNENLIRFDDCSPFQTYEWGQYHKALGWQPYYFAATDARGEIVAMLLGLLRRYPLGIGLMWCTGGPVGDIETWGESLHKAVLSQTKLKRLYLRFRCDRERNLNDVLFLNSQNWSRSLFAMTSCVSMELDLSKGEDKLLSKLSRNWRRNLKTANSGNLTVKLCPNPDIKELCAVYEEMEQRKNLPPQFSFEKLEKLFSSSKPNLIFYRCEDAEGNLVSFRGCLITGNRACDYLAATTERGRELRASYAVFWKLLEHCQKQGLHSYDLGGIDFWQNPGVYKFKKDTGAREIEYLGEWDWASQPWLRLFGNWAIWQKQRIRKVESFSVSNYLPHKWFSNKLSPSIQSDIKSAQLSEVK
jgi:hypothetical protein